MGESGPLAIEDYALIGDRHTASLVGKNGSIDWLCLPHFDSAACFAALLGDPRNGRWRIAPASALSVRRHYWPGTMVLETVFSGASGEVAIIDFMVPESMNPTLVRIVEGRSGRVAMETDFAARFDYGFSVPWVTRVPHSDAICAIAGPDMVVLYPPFRLHGHDMRHGAAFDIEAGQRACFVLRHGASHLARPEPVDAEAALDDAADYWRGYSGRLAYDRPWREAIERSLLVLRSLAYAPTGGIVAAPTTSLPEQLGGPRNWDYRYCWLRDASLSLYALMGAGYYEEAGIWRDWLQRAVAGSAEQIQIMYGLHGERRLAEWEVPWLEGYQGAKPVRIGNGAAGQLQLDVFGEVVECLHQARRHKLREAHAGWALQRTIVERLARIWEEKDEGIWEVRGGRRHFTFSKVMAWVAFDRMIADATSLKLEGPVERWRALRDDIAARIFHEGFDSEKNSFVQSFGSKELDASLLLLAPLGFVPPTDPRYVGTVAAIERELLDGGFVLRYRTESSVDGLPSGEGAFLACSFWLADAYAMTGRERDAQSLYERLLALRNDVGLLAEEYDPRTQRQVGNFPQAFSHVALTLTGMALAKHGVAPEARCPKAA